MQLLGTGKQRAAKTSRVGVGSQFLTFASWEANMQGEDFVTVNFESYNVAAAETYDEGILGKVWVDYRFGGDWDAGTNPLGSPPGLFVRDDLASVDFFTSRLDAINWAFPFLRVRGSTNGGEIAGKVTFNTSGKSQGPFTFPTGSV